MKRNSIRTWLATGSFAFLAACGGGGGEPAASPGAATIGAAGGTVLAGNGAQVVFPKDALSSDTTVRISQDSTGAPPLPPAAEPAGAVYAFTPHGGAFAAHAEVSIPVERIDIAANQQLLLVTAEPGDTQWRVLSGATYANGVLRAPVMHFSFFQAIILTNYSVPSLVTTVGDRYTSIGVSNNVGGASVGRFAPDFEFNDGSYLQSQQARLEAKLTYPAQPVVRKIGLPNVPPPRPCLPTSYGHNGAVWRFLRNGSEPVAPATLHLPISSLGGGPDSNYPRYDNEIDLINTAWNSYFRGLVPGPTAVPGFGALHVYGQDTPRHGGYLPAGSDDSWAMPPPGNSADDDQLMWHSFLLFNGEEHNGRMRIDVTVATDCNLLIEAVPMSFQINLASRNHDWAPYEGVIRLAGGVNPAAGTTAVLPFLEAMSDSSLSITWEYSHDPVNWEKLSVPPQYIRDDGVTGLSNQYPFGRGYSVVIPNVQPSHTGWYRAWACSKPRPYQPGFPAVPSICLSKPPIWLVVHTEPPTVITQPVSQTVQIGETASFTVIPGGPPVPSVQWQKRSLVAAAFGFPTWTTIDGATELTYTTSPTNVNDSLTQYRAVVSTVLGNTPSDAALLTVLEQVTAPVVQSQPANLNVLVGSTAVFVATVSGTAPLSYQWQRNGTNLTGANSPVLTLNNVSALADGGYQLVVTNRGGTVTSDRAALVVTLGTPVALPPTIAAPPTSIVVAAGNAANFAVAVNGSGPYTYSWLTNNGQTPISGADGPSYSIPSAGIADAGTYSVRVTNSVGTVVSAAATLTVTPGTGKPVAPLITTAPVGLAVLPGAGATFAVAVSGTAPFTYQWRHNGADIDGATDAVLHIAAVGALDAGQYALEVRNAAGMASSEGVPLIVIGAPLITQQPASVAEPVGATARFSVGAIGDGPRYQWVKNSLAIDNATDSSYTTPPLALADNGAVYSVIVYNGAGLVFSQGAVLTVNSAVTAPSVTLHPPDKTVAEGESAYIEASFGGTLPLTFELQRFVAGAWKSDSPGGAPVDNNNIAMSTGSLLATDSGAQFRIMASNAAGSVTTNVATVTVTAASTNAVAMYFNNFDGPATVAPGVTATLTKNDIGTWETVDVQGFAGLGPAGGAFAGNMLRVATATTVTLTLNNLPAHSALSLGFLFAAIDSLDGGGNFPSNDRLYIRIVEGDILLFQEPFENATGDPTKQSYVGPAGVQLARRVDLGFGGPGGINTDSAYNLALDERLPFFRHTANSVSITFVIEGVGPQTLSDESWGMDNLRVLLHP